MAKTTAEYELGRYKKKVEDQQKVIADLRSQLQEVDWLMEANNAILAAVVKSCGEVSISQDDINAALESKLGMKLIPGAERTYTLRTAVSADGEKD